MWRAYMWKVWIVGLKSLHCQLHDQISPTAVFLLQSLLVRGLFCLFQSDVLNHNCERIKRLARDRQRSLKELRRTYFQGMELFMIYFVKKPYWQPQNLARIGILLSSLSRFLTLELGSGKTYCIYGYAFDNFMIRGSSRG